MRPVIELRSIAKWYAAGAAREIALKGIDLLIEHGEFVSIVGQSGSGKSTLLNIIGCLDTSSAGRYKLDGETISELKEPALAAARCSTIGFVFQSFHLLARSTVLDNVALPALYAGEGRRAARTKALDILRRFGVAEVALRLPSQLSGGQRQRCAIARALINNPKVVLADEPTGNLDSANAGAVVRTLRDLNTSHGVTVVLVTHDATLAHSADRVVRLHDGSIVYDGQPTRVTS